MKSNPFNRPMPVMVLIRNNTLAIVEQIVDDTKAFPLLGRFGIGDPQGSVIGRHGEHLGPERAASLWRRDGAWRENGAKSEFDIVGVVTGRDQNGSLVYEPFAAAAGNKETAS